MGSSQPRRRAQQEDGGSGANINGPETTGTGTTRADLDLVGLGAVGLDPAVLAPLDTNGPASRPIQIDHIGSCELPTPWAIFRLHGFALADSGEEHIALTLGEIDDGAPVLARVHSECLTGDALFSQRCDCGAQLQEAMKRIAAQGRGVILYMRQEGRGIGLLNKIRAYRLQDAGADTVEANIALGFKPDLRGYELCKPMLDHLGVGAIRLMTNNPAKMSALEAAGVQITERLEIVAGRNASNQRYLRTKQAKLGHVFADWVDEDA